MENFHSDFGYLESVISLEGLPDNRRRDFATLRQLLTGGGGTRTENVNFAACLTCFCVRYAMTPAELFDCKTPTVVATAAHALQLTFTYQSQSAICAYLGKTREIFRDQVFVLTDAQRKAAKATADDARRLLTYLNETT